MRDSKQPYQPSKEIKCCPDSIDCYNSACQMPVLVYASPLPTRCLIALGPADHLELVALQAHVRAPIAVPLLRNVPASARRRPERKYHQRSA